jgi:general secretion pathway protein J
MKATMQARRGFTLVEVLVALMIMAVLSTMAWQGIDGIVRARDISREQLDRTLRLNTVLAQWEQDLQSLQPTPLTPPLSFDGATLRIVRQAPGGLQVVAWTLQGTKWRRWAGPVVTRVGDLRQSLERSRNLLGDEAGLLQLLDGVSSVHLEFHRLNAWTNPQSTGADIGGVRLVLSLGEQRLTRDIVLAAPTP